MTRNDIPPLKSQPRILRRTTYVNALRVDHQARTPRSIHARPKLRNHSATRTNGYEPLDFLAKLAALIPRPHKNLVLYHGVLAARSRWRARVVAYRREAEAGADCEPLKPSSQCTRGAWAELMRRAFGYDLLACANCGGKRVYGAIPEMLPKMMISISGAAHFSWFGPDAAGMGTSGKDALAFQKVFLDGDESGSCC